MRIAAPMLALAMACGERPAAEPRGPADMAGRITHVQRSGERIGSIHVQGADSAGISAAVVQITQGTVVARDAGRADFNALRTGQEVRVWFDGPVRESHPVQATASVVRVR